MKPHSQLGVPDPGEMKAKKKWRMLLFVAEERAAQAIQMAFEQKGSPLIPASQNKIRSWKVKIKIYRCNVST